jgi:spore coat protein U-like protein
VKRGSARGRQAGVPLALLWAVFAQSLPIEVEAASPNAASCAVSATGLNFGVYDPLSAAPLVASGQVTVTCGLAGGMAVRVSLTTSYSMGSSGSYALRTMRSGTNPLNYNLFFDAAFTQICGNGTGGSSQGQAAFTLNPRTPTRSTTSVIYGRIPAGQDVLPGTYTDTIVVTVTY